MKEVADKITDVVKEVAPHILFIPHRGDLCYDHRIVHEASLVAARPCIIKIKRILSYEVPSETDWALFPFSPNVYVDIADWVSKKIEAMKVYKSELKESPHPRSIDGIYAYAKKRGLEAGMQFAEAFILIRDIV
jgi:LmbE family N-acetylglucosaminyl deacetylase